jgi:hypothetical protein
VTNITVFGSLEVIHIDFPNIHIFLGDLGTSIGFSIPTLTPALSVVNQITPAVEYEHFKFVGINAFAQREEQVVQPITIWSKGVGNKYYKLLINYQTVSN